MDGDCGGVLPRRELSAEFVVPRRKFVPDFLLYRSTPDHHLRMQMETSVAPCRSLLPTSRSLQSEKSV